MENKRDLHATFAALGNPTRLAIVEKLLADGECAAGEFAGLHGVSAPALSRHFQVLVEAGIISRRPEKQKRFYAARPEAVKAIGNWSLTYQQFWSGGLDRLSGILDREAARQ